ncbi:hypothetical protein B0H19DRAFT_1056675 [Mycena capillaripes]|nr:hypothetical protein B0H19DRAFT_1056675 [Mycena capillaripes]
MRESSKIWRFFQIVLGGFLEQSDQSDDFRRTGRGISLRDALERWVALEPSDLEAPKRPLSLRVRQGYSVVDWPYLVNQPITIFWSAILSQIADQLALRSV